MVYSPKPPPIISNVEELRQYVDDELRNVALEFSKTNVLWLNPLAREPNKPREGMVIYADGTNLDFGFGSGVHEYDGTNWIKAGNDGVAHGLFWVDRNGTNQGSLTASADNKIQFTNEVYDVEGYFDNATNFRYTPLLEGIYQITVSVRATHSADQTVVALVYKNGASVARGNFHSPDSAVDSRSIVTAIVAMNGSTDYVEGWARVPAGPTIVGAVDGTYMFGYRIRGL